MNNKNQYIVSVLQDLGFCINVGAEPASPLELIKIVTREEPKRHITAKLIEDLLYKREILELDQKKNIEDAYIFIGSGLHHDEKLIESFNNGSDKRKSEIRVMLKKIKQRKAMHMPINMINRDSLISKYQAYCTKTELNTKIYDPDRKQCEVTKEFERQLIAENMMTYLLASDIKTPTAADFNEAYCAAIKDEPIYFKKEWENRKIEKQTSLFYDYFVSGKAVQKRRKDGT